MDRDDRISTDENDGVNKVNLVRAIDSIILLRKENFWINVNKGQCAKFMDEKDFHRWACSNARPLKYSGLSRQRKTLHYVDRVVNLCDEHGG